MQDSSRVCILELSLPSGETFLSKVGRAFGSGRRVLGFVGFGSKMLRFLFFAGPWNWGLRFADLGFAGFSGLIFGSSRGSGFGGMVSDAFSCHAGFLV